MEFMRVNAKPFKGKNKTRESKGRERESKDQSGHDIIIVRKTIIKKYIHVGKKNKNFSKLLIVSL